MAHLSPPSIVISGPAFPTRSPAASPSSRAAAAVSPVQMVLNAPAQDPSASPQLPRVSNGLPQRQDINSRLDNTGPGNAFFNPQGSPKSPAHLHHELARGLSQPQGFPNGPIHLHGISRSFSQPQGIPHLYDMTCGPSQLPTVSNGSIPPMHRPRLPLSPLRMPPLRHLPPLFSLYEVNPAAASRPHDRMTSGSGSNGGGSSGSSRLPIFHDDLSFNDRRGRSLFDDLQRQMDEDFGNMGLRSGLRSRNKWGRDWDDDPNSIFKDFFELRPRNPKLGKISREDASSRESLDDNTTKTLFTEDPQTKTRMFQISFNVQEYNPEDISVKVVEDSLLVEAKHVDSGGPNQSTREFSRKIAIPKEVDPDKLSSTMSNDGILTIKAPVPPQYQSIAPVSSPTPTSNYSEKSSAKYAPSSTAQASYAPHPGSTYQQPPYSPPPTGYQDNQTYPGTSYPSAPPHSSYYAPPPATQPRMSAPVPHMQPPQMGPQSPTFSQAHTMTSPASHGMYYSQQQPFSPTSMQDFPPPPPQPQMFAAAPMTMAQQDFPPPPPEAPLPTLDIPTYVDTPTGRRMDLALFLGPPYTPEDILVKVDGKTLMIEACHTEKKDKKTSKASMSREFELAEDINPQTVQANLTNDGHLKLAAMVPLPGEKQEDEAEEEQQQQPVSTSQQ